MEGGRLVALATTSGTSNKNLRNAESQMWVKWQEQECEDMRNMGILSDPQIAGGQPNVYQGPIDEQDI